MSQINCIYLLPPSYSGIKVVPNFCRRMDPNSQHQTVGYLSQSVNIFPVAVGEMFQCSVAAVISQLDARSVDYISAQHAAVGTLMYLANCGECSTMNTRPFSSCNASIRKTQIHITRVKFSAVSTIRLRHNGGNQDVQKPRIVSTSFTKTDKGEINQSKPVSQTHLSY